MGSEIEAGCSDRWCLLLMGCLAGLESRLGLRCWNRWTWGASRRTERRRLGRCRRSRSSHDDGWVLESWVDLLELESG